MTITGLSIYSPSDVWEHNARTGYNGIESNAHHRTYDAYLVGWAWRSDWVRANISQTGSVGSEVRPKSKFYNLLIYAGYPVK